METDLQGRVRNFGLKPKHCFIPLFEAVTNSLQAIDDRAKNEGTAFADGCIRIEINRGKQPLIFDREDNSSLKSIRISDNGIGFDEEHFSAFRRLDNSYRLAFGGKGVGRISWLSVFQNAKISSCYYSRIDGKYHKIDFTYSIQNDGVGDELVVDAAESELGSVIELQTLLPEFRNAWPKKPMTLVHKLIVYLQKTLALANCPQIIFSDPAIGPDIDLREFFRSEFLVDSKTEKMSIGSEVFFITHALYQVKTDVNEHRHTVTLLAGGRPAEESKIIPMGLGFPRGPIKRDRESHFYMAFVEGSLLNSAVNDSRTHVDLKSEDEILDDGDITREQIIRETAILGKKFLGERLEQFIQEQWVRIEQLCETEIRFRPLLKHCREKLEQLDFSLSDQKLASALYEIHREYRSDLQEKMSNVAQRARKHITDLKNFRSELKQVIEGWNDAAMADLASYVADRRAVLWFLKNRLKYSADAKYHFEEAVHAVFFPLGQDTDSFPADSANLWLIDERLSYQAYLASDKKLSAHRTLANDSKSEPDIAIYNSAFAFGAPEGTRATITLVEFKRPGRDDYTMDDNPYVQACDYIKQIRAGSAKSRDGRPISNFRDVNFVVYLVCDQTPSLERVLTMLEFCPTTDARGSFRHNSQMGAYFEVLTFDKLIEDATARNKVLFDRLGLPLSPNVPDGVTEEEMAKT